MIEVIKMPYDLYDYFLKQKRNPIFTEVSDKVRQDIWAESVNFVMSLKWMAMEDRMLIELYYYLRYN